MDRDPLRRDFTLGKAALLVALLGLAAWMGDVPAGHDTAQEAADPHQVMPALSPQAEPERMAWAPAAL